MMHIKDSLLLIGKSSPCGGSGFPLSLSAFHLILLQKDVKFIPRPGLTSTYGNVTVTSETETSLTGEISLRMLNVETKVRYTGMK